MRRIVTKAIGIVLLLCGVVFAVMLVVGLSHSTWFHGKLPPDTLPTTASQAEDVAFSLASNAGCGNFDNELPPVSPTSWRFGCDIGNVPYAIYVYGGDDARSQGLAELRADGRPFVAKAYYAVTALRTETTKHDAFTATPPPDAIMDPFK
jgi:hypothetical protein